MLLPLLLMWKLKMIFSPVHVIFLELIMGPTCSIIYENEPMEPGTMQRPARKPEATFLSLRQLMLSIFQGLMITGACLGLGYYFMQQGEDDGTVRTVIFTTLLFSNIFLTLANRSFIYSIFTTIRYKNNLIPIILSITLLFIAASIYVPFIRDIFLLEVISLNYILFCALAAMVGTLWIELWKLSRRILLPK